MTATSKNIKHNSEIDKIPLIDYLITRVEDQILDETFHRFEGPIQECHHGLVLRHFG